MQHCLGVAHAAQLEALGLLKPTGPAALGTSKLKQVEPLQVDLQCAKIAKPECATADSRVFRLHSAGAPLISTADEMCVATALVGIADAVARGL